MTLGGRDDGEIARCSGQGNAAVCRPLAMFFTVLIDDIDHSPRKNQTTDKGSVQPTGFVLDRGNKVEKLKSVPVRLLTCLDTAFFLTGEVGIDIDMQTADQKVLELKHGLRLRFSNPGTVGCMVSLGLVNRHPQDAELRAHMATLRRATVALIRTRLEQGVADGDLPGAIDVDGFQILRCGHPRAFAAGAGWSDARRSAAYRFAAMTALDHACRVGEIPHSDQ